MDALLASTMHAVSDYESDAFIAEKVELPSVSRSDHELNLSVLKRHDPNVIALHYVSPYAVVYIFNPTSEKWEKSGIEGSTFVCGLAANLECDQRSSVMVLNRRGLDNFSIEVKSTHEIEVTDEYIILQSEQDGQLQVYGLWVYSEPPPSSTAHHREMAAAKILECASKAELSRKSIFERDLNGYEAEMEEEVVPSARQASSRQNSLQPRSHENVVQPENEALAHPQTRPQSTLLFSISADTDFFRSSQRHGPPPSQQNQKGSPLHSRSALLDLFRSSSSSKA